ncbi:unnamed protein product [Arabidopsis arenosa]|uniref:Uncharacterized protein n=1 Tax=Arabidopsis arenosa TaxID=38785 RepID=A0A8S1ZL17_ARAAE|nr:unnamed protein product [Arabidopsis arenosa]
MVHSFVIGDDASVVTINSPLVRILCSCNGKPAITHRGGWLLENHVVVSIFNQNTGDSSSDSGAASSRSNPSTNEADEVATIGGDGGDGQLLAGEDVASMCAKFKKLMVTLIPPMEFGEGLILKDTDLLQIPTNIPPDYPHSLFNNTDPVTDPRADLLPCKFHGSLAILFAKFKKSKRKETFEFDSALLNEITTSFKRMAPNRRGRPANTRGNQVGDGPADAQDQPPVGGIPAEAQATTIAANRKEMQELRNMMREILDRPMYAPSPPPAHGVAAPQHH